MIGRLRGSLERLEPGLFLVDVGGVGYLVRTNLRAFEKQASGDDVLMWIHSIMREDSLLLYGFENRKELEVFQRLISVAGVGSRCCNGLPASAEKPPSGSSWNSRGGCREAKPAAARVPIPRRTPCRLSSISAIPNARP